MLEKMAEKLANKRLYTSEQKDKHNVSTSLSAFTSYEGEVDPITFIATFEDQCAMANIAKGEDKMRIFPTLLKGSKAAAAH